VSASQWQAYFQVHVQGSKSECDLNGTNCFGIVSQYAHLTHYNKFKSECDLNLFGIFITYSIIDDSVLTFCNLILLWCMRHYCLMFNAMSFQEGREILVNVFYWKYIQFAVSFSKDLEYRNPFHLLELSSYIYTKLYQSIDWF
jgi:hypothetical protein